MSGDVDEGQTCRGHWSLNQFPHLCARPTVVASRVTRFPDRFIHGVGCCDHIRVRNQIEYRQSFGPWQPAQVRLGDAPKVQVPQCQMYLRRSAHDCSTCVDLSILRLGLNLLAACQDRTKADAQQCG
jgi:hypothetical protein